MSCGGRILLSWCIGKYGENESIRNYWKFLSEDDEKALVSELNGDYSNEIEDKADEVDNSDYDTLDEMDRDISDGGDT